MSKVIFTKSLGKLVTENKPEGDFRYHVISDLGHKWSVISDESSRVLKSFEDQSEAINYAREKLSNGCGTVIVHNKKGQISDTILIGLPEDN